MSVAAGRKDPALRIPVAAYATDLQAGTALFLLSDSVLAVQEFLLGEPRPVLESVVMATYTAGQGLIATGAAASGVRFRRSRDRGRPPARTAGRRAGRGSTPCT